MKHYWKRFLSIMICVLMVLSIVPVQSFAREFSNVVYLNGEGGDDSKDGLSASNSVQTLTAALDAVSNGGTIVVCGNTTIDSATEISKEVIITSKYDTQDYLDVAVLEVSAEITLEADVKFNDIIMNGNDGTIYAQGNLLILDEGVSNPVDEYSYIVSLNVIYGGSKIKAINSDTNIIIKSGRINTICGGCEQSDVNGNTNITISGGDVDYVYGSSKFGAVSSANITINGGDVDDVYGSSYNGTVSSANITINGGDVYTVSGSNSGISDRVNITIEGGNIRNVYSSKFGTVDSSNITINGGNMRKVCGRCSSSVVSSSAITVANGTTPVVIEYIENVDLLKIGDDTQYGSLTLIDDIRLRENVKDVVINRGSTLFLKDSSSITGDFTGGGTLKLGKYGSLEIGGTAIGETVLEVSEYKKNNSVLLTVTDESGNGDFINDRCTKTSIEGSGIYKLATTNVDYWSDEGKYDAELYNLITDVDFSEDTITISSPSELAAVAAAVNKEGEDAGIDLSGKTIILSKDIDLSGYLWDPIGIDGDHMFRGNFDGNGHVISNMNIMGEYKAAGLFGFVVGSKLPSVIKNVTVNGKISLEEISYVGGIVGEGEAITIQNCSNDTSITVLSDVQGDKETDVGGILGTGKCAFIDGCTNKIDADISVTAPTSLVGGIVGTVYEGGIYNSANFGTVMCTNPLDQVAGAGGIVGFGETSTVNNCYNTGVVTAIGSKAGAGGICGGIVGGGRKTISRKTYSPEDIVAPVLLNNCYNAGKVNATYAGGIAAGMISADMKDCYYLDSTATGAYYTIEDLRHDFTESVLIAGDSLNSSQMQDVAFLDKLNGWVTENPTIVGNGLRELGEYDLDEEDLDLGVVTFNFKEWKQVTGVNMGYPVFMDDTRQRIKHSSGGSSKPNNGANIIVNGNNLNAGTAVDTTKHGRTTTTITVDEKILEAKLKTEGNNVVVRIPVKTDSDTLNGVLNGQMIKNMENKKGIIELKTDSATYTLPAHEINIGAVSEQIGKNVELKDINVIIEISKPTQEAVKIVENSAKAGDFTIVAPAVEFNVKCTYGGNTVNVKKFNSYVERLVAIPVGVDPLKITTGVIIDADGTVRHVPTKIVIIDGKYYAKINSLTNSIYSVVWNPIEFKDVEKHWAKDAINDMGSRMVISGIGDNLFEPNRDITRAEFAAIVIRSLGLELGAGNSSFTDVKSADWYCKYIETASNYGIISGYGNGTFGPMDKITREQAMTIVARTMKITNLNVEFESDEVDKLLSEFVDSGKSATWANESIAACVKASVVTGKSSNTLAPKDKITRAEVAMIIQRLLQKSKLI